ncbi:MAG: peroxiredoxin family protein [Bacteroidales bacterium]
MRYFVYILCMMGVYNAYAQECSIFATNPTYAGKHIEISTLDNFISNEKIILYKGEVNKLGTINITIPNISTPKLAYLDAGQYRILFYLEANVTLNFTLPNYKERTPEQLKNPFFRADEIWAQLALPKKSLTDFVMKTDIRYSTVMNAYFGTLRYRYSDSLITLANDIIADSDDDKTKFRSDYLQYRKHMLEYSLRPHKWLNIIHKYLNKELLLNNSSFTSLFDEVFRNHVDVDISKDRKFIAIINRADHKSIVPYIKNKYQISDNTAYLIAIKSIYNGYYLNYFGRQKCIDACKYLSTKTMNDSLKKIATEVYKKVYHLSVNSPAPHIALSNINGGNISLDSFDKNKMLLIHFSDIDLYTAKQEISYLNTMTVGMDDFIEVMYLFKTGNSPDSIANFVKQYDIKGQFAICNTSLPDEYRVVSWPTTYLLDESNKLLESPAQNPMSGLDRTLKNLIRQKQAAPKRQENKVSEDNSFNF